MKPITAVFSLLLILAAGLCKAQAPLLSPPPLMGAPGIFYSAAPPIVGPHIEGPGDVIPQCYMIYGYGRDAHGNGPFLDAGGNALPLKGPNVTMVWNQDNPTVKRATPDGLRPHPHFKSRRKNHSKSK